MKESRYFSLYLPEYKDDIDISEISDNFNRLDSGLEAMLIKKDITTNTINDIAVFPPFWSVKNPHDFDVVIYDRIFEKEITVEAGKTYKAQVDHGTKLNIHVQGLHELEFTYYISTEQAIEAAKGSDYKLTQITSEEFSASYKLQVKPKGSEEYIDVPASAVINIPKDKVVKSGDVKTCQTDGVPEGFKKGDKYIDLVIDNDEGSHIYIPVNALVDNRADGISYSNTTSKMKATNVQSAIDEVAETVFKQTEIVPVSSVANTVTVPSDIVGDFAAVKMIGGKTVKSRNILNHTATSGASASGAFTWTVNEDKSITLNGTTTEVTTFRLIGANGTGKEVLFSGTNSIIWCSNNSTIESGMMSIKASNQSSAYTEEAKVTNPVGTIVGDITYLYARISANKTFNNVTIYPMLVKGTTTDATYEPYFEGLHSAPVKKVISLGKDMLNGNYEFESGFVTGGGVTATYGNDGVVNLSGLAARDTGSLAFTHIRDNGVYTLKYKCSRRIEIVARKYLGSTGGNYFVDEVIKKDTQYESTLSVSFDSTYDSVIIFARPRIAYGTYNDDKLVVALYDNSFKTTVSLADIAKNLPDYGIEGNYIDFEEMKYHHINKINSDGSDVEPLAEPEIIDLSDILAPFAVEPNGTIEFVNEHNLDVPNTVLYEKEVLV